MAVKTTNNARSTLAVSVTSTETVVRVRVGHGVKFPLLTEEGEWFPLALEDVQGNIEYLRATAREGDSITVQRGAEGSQARPFAAGDLCELRLTSAALEDLQGGGQPGVLPSVSISNAVLGG